MPVNKSEYLRLKEELGAKNISLIAVSKTISIAEIKELYDLGQRDFGENYVQELVAKAQALPTDIRWHFIGHLQSNKVKLIADFVQLVQSVDSLKLLKEIDKQGARAGRVVHCLLQVYIAEEESKFGLNVKELEQIFSQLQDFPNVKVEGMMGMATLTGNAEQVRKEYQGLKKIFQNQSETKNYQPAILSMGMSGDYRVAVEEGSTMVRIGSMVFGERN